MTSFFLAHLGIDSNILPCSWTSLSQISGFNEAMRMPRADASGCLTRTLCVLNYQVSQLEYFQRRCTLFLSLE